MKKRSFLKLTTLSIPSALLLTTPCVYAKTYMNREQAKQILLGNVSTKAFPIELTKEQRKAIKKASRVRVNNSFLDAHRTSKGEWLIYDEVIGKHENIDMAFAFSKYGKVIGMEVLVYRETYGHEVRDPKWKAQFVGRGNEEHLKLDKQIKNISGATLSCRHITDAINRLTHTWEFILKDLK